MEIIQDVKPKGADSAYVIGPFDEAKAELGANGYNIISLEQFAKLRIAQGKESHIANCGGCAKEGFLHVPRKGIFLVRNSPILVNAEQATACSKDRREFYLTQEQVEEALTNSVQFKNANRIPTNRFAEDERTIFAFGETAGKYGEFLKESGIAEMPVELSSPENKPFARQAWLSEISNDHDSELFSAGNLYWVAVRGGRNIEPRSGETISAISTPSLTDIAKYSRQFVPESARNDFEKGLETLFNKQ